MGFGFGSVMRKKLKGDRFWWVERSEKKKKLDDCRSSDSIAKKKDYRNSKKEEGRNIREGLCTFHLR